MAVGRVGCLLTELPGTPTGTSCGITLDPAAAQRLGAPAGVPLHPSFVYEIVFHAAAFAVLWFWLRHRARRTGGDPYVSTSRVRRLPLPRRVRARQRGGRGTA